MRRILLCFDALDDPVLDIVEGNADGGRFFPRAALGAGCRKPHVCGELLDIQRREDFQRRPIIVLLALQPVKEASKRGPLRRFHNPYVGQSLRAAPPSTAATLELPVSRNRPAIWAEVVEPREPAPFRPLNPAFTGRLKLFIRCHACDAVTTTEYQVFSCA